MWLKSVTDPPLAAAVSALPLSKVADAADKFLESYLDITSQATRSRSRK